MQDVVVMMLDRPRHKEIVAEIRRVGASLRMISDGDIAAAMAPAYPESGIDLYVGIGGAPEAVLAAAGIKCLGGDMQCMMWPRDENENARADRRTGTKTISAASFLPMISRTGRTSFFARPASATARCCRGVKTQGASAITHSVLMRAKSKTVRFIRASHDLQSKTIRLRSDNREHWPLNTRTGSTCGARWVEFRRQNLRRN